MARIKIKEMTKREIVEILKKYEHIAYTSMTSDITGIFPGCYDVISDEILALPIDVPTNADIEAWAISNTEKYMGDYSILVNAKIEGAKAMRDGEIKQINKQKP
jgi:hypothetical protein